MVIVHNIVDVHKICFFFFEWERTQKHLGLNSVIFDMLDKLFINT